MKDEPNIRLNNTSYINYLYRRNNHGKPTMWHAFPTGENTLHVLHGVVNGIITNEVINTHRSAQDEVNSRVKAKRKQGYKYLSEIKDNTTLPVKEELYEYLNKYLPDIRTFADGTLSPMLAKAYDNKDNKLFNKSAYYLGQWKINGLRCFIGATIIKNGLFEETRLKFQSREGTYWNSLTNLEDYLLNTLPANLLKRMIDEDWLLDGELYLPGYTINEINHFVKNVNAPQNKLIQFWCYDIAMDEVKQEDRINTLKYHANAFVISPGLIERFGKTEHLGCTRRFNILPNYFIYDEDNALSCRDIFIKLGFEGLIMRNPNEEYQFGKRNLSMIKFKAHQDGLFTIIDLKSEGIKRPDIPLFICKNDINDAEFSVHIGGSLDYQRECFKNKESFIGKQLYIEYGERSGVNELPFHVKLVKLHNE